MYEEAEEQDRQRARQRAAAEAAEKQRAEEEARRAAEERAQAEEAKELADAIALSKVLHKESILAAARRRMEAHPEPAPIAGETADIRFTLPTGTKLQRRFLGADSLQCLFDYIVIASAEIGTPMHHFDMGTNYPKREFAGATADLSQSIRAAGVFPRAMLFVTQTPGQIELDRQDAVDEGAPSASAVGGGGAVPS